MARKAATVSVSNEVREEVFHEKSLTPEQRKAEEKAAKRAAEEALAKVRTRFAKVELPMRRSGEPPKYCVLEKGYEPLVRQVAEERGYAICMGRVLEPVVGFSLHSEKPSDAERISGPDPTENQRARQRREQPRIVPKSVRMPGIPILYAVVIQSTSPDMGSVSQNAERHFDARIQGRGGLEVSMGANGPFLHIRAKRGAKIDYLLVPMTNVVKMHPDPTYVAGEEWGAEPAEAGKE